jgi:hypothetical protein
MWRYAIAVGVVLTGCTEVRIEDGSGGDGTTANTTTANTTVSSTATGQQPCELRNESACLQGNDCVGLYDWSPVIDDAPPLPPDTPVNPDDDPCCPSCREQTCAACHVGVFKECIIASDCGLPRPPDRCGVPNRCP